MEWDIFVSHAHEDKETVARPLSEELKKLGYKVWLDEWEIKLGDSISRTISRGLAQSEKIVVVLSKAFLAKKWPKEELASALSLETATSRKVLPVWHGITADDLKLENALLLDRLAVRTEEGLGYVAGQIAAVLRPIEQADIDPEKITVLLPDSLVPVTARMYAQNDYNVVWQKEHYALVEQVKKTKIDVAFEWHYYEGYRPMLDLLRSVGSEAVVFLCQNLGGEPLERALAHGYDGFVSVFDVPNAVDKIEGAMKRKRLAQKRHAALTAKGIRLVKVLIVGEEGRREYNYLNVEGDLVKNMKVGNEDSEVVATNLPGDEFLIVRVKADGLKFSVRGEEFCGYAYVVGRHGDEYSDTRVGLSEIILV